MDHERKADALSGLWGRSPPCRSSSGEAEGAGLWGWLQGHLGQFLALGMGVRPACLPRARPPQAQGYFSNACVISAFLGVLGTAALGPWQVPQPLPHPDLCQECCSRVRGWSGRGRQVGRLLQLLEALVLGADRFPEPLRSRQRAWGQADTGSSKLACGSQLPGS